MFHRCNIKSSSWSSHCWRASSSSRSVLSRSDLTNKEHLAPRSAPWPSFACSGRHILQWHWYQDGGDFENAIGTSSIYNVIAKLKSTYNMPIIFKEIGSSPDQSTAAQQTYITKTIAELVAAKATYNVVCANWYELYDYPNDAFGVMTSGSAKKATYATLKSMIAENPVA